MKDMPIPHCQTEGEVLTMPADRILEGNPVFTLWELNEKPVATGFWAATPGVHRMLRDDVTWEQCLILEGLVEITEDGKDPIRYAPGDVLTIPPLFKGTWRTIEAARKYYVTVTG